ncbi:putative poly(glycerol-phosphate) alpha-glucosyltransferase [termite gut metagenome]|uniref:Putative poly(Glycerol-phosphate) alpha-glucosyltransferase n=1 Tax=termite gut metagenome TaxID=433724 RepID=A0A5J4S4J0_9ZZZZ
MKICYFHSDITLKGGIERVLSILTTKQVQDFNQEVIIVSQYKTFSLPNFVFNERVKIVYLTNRMYDGTPGSFHRLLILLQNRKKIKHFFQANKFDIILSQAFPNTFLLLYSHISLRNVIAVEHVYYNYYNKWIKKIRILVYKKVKAVVVLTNNDKKYFTKYLPNVYVIPNPIELSIRYKAPLSNKKIISIGRLEYQKGYDNLIKIFSNIHKQHPEWVLDIWGEGSWKKRLQIQIKEARLESCFFLKGITTEINEKLKEASIFVVSSRFEGFSMVLVEAMSQGIPCASFDCPNGPSDIITHRKDGLLIADQNIAELEKAILELIQNKSLREELGKQAFKKIECFDVNLIIKKWNQLYNCVVNDHE